MIKNLEIINTFGLHARAANSVVTLANEFDEEIVFRFEGKEADAKSLVELLILAAPKGSMIEVEVSGENTDAEAEVMESLENLFSIGFYESDD